jgi:hypothetical protein
MCRRPAPPARQAHRGWLGRQGIVPCDHRDQLLLAARCAFGSRADASQQIGHAVDQARLGGVGGDRAEPKTAAGRRTVPLPGLIVEVLDQHVSRYGLAREADALVFSAPRGGRLHAANWHKRAWLPARRAAGWPTLRFHNLRHSAVPLWIAMGANLLQVSRWLGHSTVQITADVYGHLFPETNDLVIGRLDKALQASLPTPTDTTATVNDPTATTRVRPLRPGT